jgi:regulator of protease activity HflC (stomatin/prohibitin superfamily)
MSEERPTLRGSFWSKKLFALAGIVGTAALAVILFFVSFSLFEYLPANEIMVIQAPFSGKLAVYTQPGVYGQWFGAVTHYQKRQQYSFSSKREVGKTVDESLRVRFAEGGHANISGVVQWEMPMAVESITKLHTLYGSQHAIDQQLVRPAIERALYMTGPLMTSYESYAARRPELLRYFEEQAGKGIYQTETVYVKQPDPITGQEKTVTLVKIVQEGGKPKMQSTSALAEFGISLLQPSFDEIKYDAEVEKQIQQQQQAIMQVQTAQAKAREAEQEALTVAKKGEAEAAKAKWEQEVIKAKEVTAAEQRKRVAELDAQAAEQTKRQQILLGEGEATRKRLVMEADGALEPKLKALVEINKYYADAIKGYQGNWVPSVVMGDAGGSRVAGSGAQQLVDLLTAKTAKELGLDMGVSGTTKTRK